MRTVLVRIIGCVIGLVIMGCGSDAEKTYRVTLRFQFDEKEATDCTTYLATTFAVTIYNETFETRYSRQFPCPLEREASVNLSAGTYYLTVALLDANDAIKSWGSAQVVVTGNHTLTVAMAEYRGGITLSWPSSLCTDLDVENLSVSASREGLPVTAVVWGASREITDVPILCAATEFKIQNIEGGTYTVSVAGFRNAESTRPRAASNIPPFKVTTGQDSTILLKNYFSLIVSDISVTWEFDSKSITSCADAGVVSIQGRLSNPTEEFSQKETCDLSGTRTFSFYDIPAGDYTVTVEGLDVVGKVTYGGGKDFIIEPGKIGKERYTVTIYLKER